MNNVTIEGMDIIDLVGQISKKNRRYQAVSLQELEEILPRHSSEFILIRKLFLDASNSYTRSLIRMLFGEIEIDIYKK